MVYELAIAYQLLSAGGFSHSEISGSKPASGSPKLFAACCVLHRLITPRHPLIALIWFIASIKIRRLVYLRKESTHTVKERNAFGSSVAKMVGPDGLEPSTPRLSSACSNQLSYEPVCSSQFKQHLQAVALTVKLR